MNNASLSSNTKHVRLLQERTPYCSCHHWRPPPVKAVITHGNSRDSRSNPEPLSTNCFVYNIYPPNPTNISIQSHMSDRYTQNNRSPKTKPKMIPNKKTQLKQDTRTNTQMTTTAPNRGILSETQGKNSIRHATTKRVTFWDEPNALGGNLHKPKPQATQKHPPEQNIYHIPAITVKPNTKKKKHTGEKEITQQT